MASNGPGAGAPFSITLRGLPLPVRLTLATFLVAVGLGYLAALLQLHFQNASPGNTLPSPNDVVEIFSGVDNWPVQKPSPPPPVSKLEQLLMAPENLPQNGSGTMAFAFFNKRDFKKAETKGPAAVAHLRKCREAEQAVLQAWIHLPDDQREKAYNDDACPMPPSLKDQPMDGNDVDGDMVKVKSIIDARCSSCHADAGLQGKKKLVDYEDFADVLEVPAVGKTSRQMSLESLTQTTHLHLLSFCMLWALTGVIFAFSSYPRWLRCVLAPGVLIAQVADVACWWLARVNGVGPYFALCIIGAGTLVGVGLLLQVALGVSDMFWKPALAGAPAPAPYGKAEPPGLMSDADKETAAPRDDAFRPPV